MKKSFSSLLMAVVVALSFLSCSKDASDEENIPVKLRYLIFIAVHGRRWPLAAPRLSSLLAARYFGSAARRCLPRVPAARK